MCVCVYCLAVGLNIRSHIQQLDKALIYEYSVSSGVILLLPVSLIKATNAWSLGYLVSGSESPKKCWSCVPRSSRVDFNSNQTLADCFHKFCASITLVYPAGRTDCRSKVL